MGDRHLFSGPGIDQCPNPSCVAPHDVQKIAGGSAGEMECLGCRARFWVGEGKAYMPEIEWPGSSSSNDLRGEVAT